MMETIEKIEKALIEEKIEKARIKILVCRAYQ